MEESAGHREHVLASAFAGGRPHDSASEARVASELKARLFGGERGDAGERYRIVRCVGAGGAGHVYEAWDAQLRRRVAIKVLRASAYAGAGETQARARLVREAQAIACVTHPNLVAVFDVGTCTPAMRTAIGDAADRAVFVVMEYLDGFTLSGWIERERPSLPAIVRAFADAARGLAAAHVAGIVHRDFKPRNAMVSADGRVCVLDFGLARAVPRDGDATATSRLRLEQPVRLDDLTEPGVVMGTPPYMAPEQYRGEPPDPRTDQFAFGVSLWESVFGERPFRGTTLAEYRAATRHPPRVPSSPRVPRWLVRILRRTLAPAARDRFASMDLVAHALDRGLRSRRRTLAVAGIGLVALAGAAVGALVEGRGVCDEASVSGAAGDQLPAIAVAFATQPRGGEVFPRVQAGIDGYDRALVSAAQEVCATPDDRRRAMAMMCLEDRAGRLQATASVLANADAIAVQHGLELLADLPPISACTRVDAMAASTPDRDPASTRQLMRADALLAAGKYDHAMELARHVAATAEAVHDRASFARAEIVVGQVELARSGVKPERAEQHLRTAWAAAEAIGDDETAAEALTLLVHTVGPVGGRFAEADLFADQARAKLARIGDPPEATAALEHEVGLLRHRQHAYDDALAAFERALQLRETLFGADAPAVALMRVEIGNTFVQLGRHRDAEPHFDAALAALEHAWGPDHPALAGPIGGLGLVARERGDLDRAAALHERALALAIATHGDTHDTVAVAASDLGSVLADLDRDAEALAAYDRALAIRLALLGPENVAVARTRSNRATPLGKLGRHAEAVDELRVAADVFARIHGPDHETVGMTLSNLGVMLRTAGDLDGALEATTRAVAILDAGERGSPHAPAALASRGALLVAMGRVAEGRSSYERALAHEPSPKIAEAIRQELERTSDQGAR